MNGIAKFPQQEGRRRRRRLRSLALVPTLMTLGNLLCGFAAIHFAMRAMYELGLGESGSAASTLKPALIERLLPSFLAIGAGLIMIGMVFDMLDGLLARVTRSTTNFGGQLDSLADVVTFGVAPAALMVALLTQELARDAILPSPISEHFVGRVAWIAAAVYVALTAVRLARFNVEHAKADFDHRTFRGFPSPGAAAVMAALILVQAQMGVVARSVIVYSMPFIALFLGFLMVSRIRYRRFHRSYLFQKKPFSQVVFLIVMVAVFWSYKAPTLLILVLWYAASGPVFQFFRFLRERGKPEQSDEHQDGSADSARRLA